MVKKVEELLRRSMSRVVFEPVSLLSSLSSALCRACGVRFGDRKISL